MSNPYGAPQTLVPRKQPPKYMFQEDGNDFIPISSQANSTPSTSAPTQSMSTSIASTSQTLHFGHPNVSHRKSSLDSVFQRAGYSGANPSFNEFNNFSVYSNKQSPNRIRSQSSPSGEAPFAPRPLAPSAEEIQQSPEPALNSIPNANVAGTPRGPRPPNIKLFNDDQVVRTSHNGLSTDEEAVYHHAGPQSHNNHNSVVKDYTNHVSNVTSANTNSSSYNKHSSGSSYHNSKVLQTPISANSECMSPNENSNVSCCSNSSSLYSTLVQTPDSFIDHQPTLYYTTIGTHSSHPKLINPIYKTSNNIINNTINKTQKQLSSPTKSTLENMSSKTDCSCELGNQPSKMENSNANKFNSLPPISESEDKIKDQMLLKWFNSVDSDKSGLLDTSELQNALVNGDWSHFSLDAIRLMLQMFDAETHRGFIDFEGFKCLCKYLDSWKDIFDKFDVNKNGFIKQIELSKALHAFGYPVSEMTVNSLIIRFGKRAPQPKDECINKRLSVQPIDMIITFDGFISSCVTVKRLSDTFRDKDKASAGVISISHDDFIFMVVANAL